MSMNTLEKQWNHAYKTQRSEVTYKGVRQYVIFRKYDDSNTVKNRMRIFYPKDSLLDVGKLFVYKNAYYLIVNKETDENDIYYKSEVHKADFTIPKLGNYYDLHCVVNTSGLESSVVESNNVMTISTGKVELWTSSESIMVAPMNPSIMVGNFYWNGRYQEMKVVNTYQDKGIFRIYAELTSFNSQIDLYNLSITNNIKASYNLEDTPTIKSEWIPKSNDKTIAYQTLEFTSSDINKATIDKNGFIRFLSAGDVTFMAYWKEMNLTSTVSVNIAENVSYYLKYNGLNEYDFTDKNTVQLSWSAYGGEPDAINTFSYTSSNKSIATISDTGILTMISDGIVDITCRWNERNTSDTQSISITKQVVETPNYWKITYTSEPKLRSGSKKKFTAKYYNSEGIEIVPTDYTGTFSVENYAPSTKESEFRDYVQYAYNTSPTTEYNYVSIGLDNDKCIGDTFDVVWTPNDGSQPCSQSVKIVSLYS